MNPPYQITTEILKRVSSISEKIGLINASFLDKPSPQLRKENRIKTIHSSLSIEGNTLTEDQITALVEDKRVLGPQKDIREVLNALKVYEELNAFDHKDIQSFLKAHGILMEGLVSDNGTFRKKGVGIIKGDQIAHMAPPSENVPFLMKNLFDYLVKSDDLSLIKSCVFHYEMEFIHPFSDGNGRMGRLWQTLILIEDFPLFEFIPFENLIHQTQNAYYEALSLSDKTGQSTPFIEYMLRVIDESLVNILDVKSKVMSTNDRLEYFYEKGPNEFSRKEYMFFFKNISSATASRDLKQGVLSGLFSKKGDKKLTVYKKMKANA
ncbi:MAG: Fic family protein [Crocinitomicaceae bacterium]|nr:Fic family protein [Crocinitomicaceae bacterium]